MAATASISLAGQIRGTPVNGELNIGPLTIGSSNSCYAVQFYQLASGANDVTVPTIIVPTGVIIKLADTNTATVTLKGVTGDTGVKIGKTGFILLTWDTASPPTTFCLSSSAAQTGLDTAIYWF